MNAAWTFKHKPKSLRDLVGNREAIRKFVEWMELWNKSVPKQRAAFLYGPTGVGKTVTVEAFANDFHMELTEKNASDYRTEEAVKRFVGLASQYNPLIGGKRIILLDELDGLTGTADRGGVKATIGVVRTTRCPMVLIANNAYDPRFRALRNYCVLIEFKKPSIGEVLERLKHISIHEGFRAEEDALKFIAARSGGDVRSAVNDLQALAQGRKELTYEHVSWLGYRDRQEKIFTVLKMIIYAKTCSGAKKAVRMADVDLNMLFQWIYENVPAHLTNPHDLADAMNALSLADLYRGRIRKTRNWKLMRYMVDFMTAGVAMARVNTKPSGWIPFKFPQRIRMLSRSKAERAMRLRIGGKIKRKCHVSAVRASKEILPYVRIIFRRNAEMAAGIAKWLGLDQPMIEYLAGSKKSQNIVDLLS